MTVRPEAFASTMHCKGLLPKTSAFRNYSAHNSIAYAEATAALPLNQTSLPENAMCIVFGCPFLVLFWASKKEQ
jgi:hypothetical protein